MRWMKTSGAGLLAAAVAGALACSDNPAGRVTGISPSAASQLDKSPLQQMQIVSAGVQFLLPEGPGVMTRTSYELIGIRQGDGDIKGELEIQVERDPRQTFHAKVACLTVVGNKANLAARVTRSSVSFVSPGSFLAWSVVDNGEGRKSPPDLTSNFFLVDQTLAMAHCANGGINPPMFPVQAGNIQVHTGGNSD